MKIGIDIDEIIAEYMKSFLEFLKTEKGIDIEYNLITDYFNCCQSKNIERKQVLKYVLEHEKDDCNLLNLELVKGSLEAITFLDEYHDICFITSRPISSKEKTYNFFKKYFPNKEFKIIFSGDCWKGSKNKSDICVDLDCSYLIEDNPLYAFDCANKGIGVFLLDKPWNKNYAKHENIIKVQSWKEILNYFEKENGR